MPRKLLIITALFLILSLVGSAGVLSYANTNLLHEIEVKLIGSDQKTAEQKPKLSINTLIGYDSAKRRLGAKMPTGHGIKMGHVEGPTREYIPDMSKPQFKNVKFTQRTGNSKVSGHATASARKVYGSSGLAKGVTHVDLFNANGWMGNQYLKTGTPDAPLNDGIRIFSNSWIGGQNPAAHNILRRVDYIVDNNGTIVVAGVNNGRNTQVPALLGSSHNAIAVGTWSSKGSSGGYTQTEVEGRVKPDVVGVRDLTSFTTPLVSATAAMILEMSETQKDPQMARPEVVKAMIMSGATKPWNWKPEPGRTLDQYLGSGVLNINNTLMIAEGQKAQPGQELKDFGWSYSLISPTDVRKYVIDKPDEAWGPFAVTLVWDRKIVGPRTIALSQDKSKTRQVFIDKPFLADLDMRLVKVENDGSRKIVTISDSERDNAEHLYIKHLPAGRYELEIVRQKTNGVPDVPWPYAIAWRVGGEKWQGDD